jgi:hypothetical protein
MANYRLATREKAGASADFQMVACPVCGARLMFARHPDADIDACGFETYRLECQECRATLAGVIDPADDALLLSQAAD